MDDRTLDELVDTVEPGMVLVREWLASATNPVVVLDGEPEAGRRSLLALQVTSRSPLGALALEAGGLLVDDGWLRVFGSGHDRLPRSIDSWNHLGDGETPRIPGALLVGDDALGGFFALNGGGIAGEQGHVYYFAPDSLVWREVADSYSGWLQFLLTGDLAEFYAGLRWSGWRDDVRSLAGDRAYSIFPPLWTEAPSIDGRSRRDVPIDELWTLHVVEFPKALGR